MRWRVHLENLIGFGYLGYRMYLARENFDGSFSVAIPPLTLEVMEAGKFVSNEKAFMDDSRLPDQEVRSFLQAMSDAAWDIGIKPKQIEDHSSELKATKYHLEDMRTLALKEKSDG